MKITTFGKTFFDLEGKEIQYQLSSGELLPLTLAKACAFSLLEEYGEEKFTGQEKSSRYSLAMKILGHNDLPVDLTSEEVVLCKEQLAKGYKAIIVGPAYQLLEGTNE